jgi:hypothetical protein
VSQLPAEEENKVIEPIEPVEESLKTVKMVGTVSKKEYMKEYQKKYRKQKKDITLNL